MFYTLWIWMLLATAGIAGGLAVFSWHKRNLPGAMPLAITALLGGVNAAAYAFELSSGDLNTQLFWTNIEYFGFVGIPLGWLFVVIQYTGHTKALTRSRLVALLVIPVVTIIAIWTNPWHGLMRQEVHQEISWALPVIAKTYGPWFWVHTVYSFTLVLAGIALLFGSILNYSSSQRGRFYILLLGTTLPTISTICYVFKLSPWPMLDTTPIATGLAGLIISWAIFRFGLLDVVPVAHRQIIDSMRDGLIVLDSRGCVADANPAALKALSVPKSVLGQPAGEAFGRYPDLVSLCCTKKPGQVELPFGTEQDSRYFEVTISNLPKINGQSAGKVIALHDTTKKKLTEDALTFASFHDAMTGIYNRAFFEKEIQRLEGSQEYPISLVSADIDGLKLINDTLGHKAGDDLIKACAEVLKSGMRRSDIIARVGGDEFAIILPNTDKATAEQVCQRLRQLAKEHSDLSPEYSLSISWGLETSLDRSLPLDQAYQMADLNMYHEKLQNSTRGRRVIVDKLRAALQSRDHIDEERIRRSRRLMIRLAEMAGLSKQEITDLVLAADLRDMGQVSIPDRVLQKEGPLSGEEWEDIKCHPEIGCKIAKSWPELAPIANVILHHHERWDGHGYPDSISGEEIPVACRIIAVVDAFDAMTSERPYRRSLTPEQALNEIQLKAGSQFDPQMARMLAGIIATELRLVV